MGAESVFFKKMVTKSEYLTSQKGDSPLLVLRVISSHLRDLNYPEKSIESMEKCGSPAGGFFYQYCNCGSSDGIRQITHHCSLRTCPVCSKKRKRRLRRKYLDFLSDYVPQNKFKFLYFLTISPQNYFNLSHGLVDIRKKFNKFLRLKYVKERLLGSLYVIEAKQSDDDSWNLHIHAIVYGRWLDNRIRGKCLEKNCGQNLMKYDVVGKKYYCASRKCGSTNVIVNENSKLVTLWKKSNKQDCHIHIQRQRDINNQNDPSWTLNYMLKYISANKDDFNTPLANAQYIYYTRKMKLISRTGCFFGKKVENIFGYSFKKDPPSCCPNCKDPLKFITSFELVSLRRIADRNIIPIRQLRPPSSQILDQLENNTYIDVY